MFIGYPQQHRGYRFLDLKTNKIIISRYLVFDESIFPAAHKFSHSPLSYEFLKHDDDPSPIFQEILQTPSQRESPHSGPPNNTTVVTQNNSSPAPNPLPVPAPSKHSMKTRSQTGVRKTKQPVSLLTSSVSPIPTTHQKALSEPNWNPAMTDEYDAQINNKTWSLVPRPKDANIVNSIWLFKHKHDADGNLTRYKARLVANGKTQEEGIDYIETFAPVVKPATIRTVLHVAVAQGWNTKQLDVKNVFLHGNLEETIFMHQPPDFVSKEHHHHVCVLHKAIYGLKKAPRAWNARFTQFAKQLGFLSSKSDNSLFVYKKGNDLAYLLLYVDDIILTGSS